MATNLEAPPVLSTPDTHILESAEPPVKPAKEILSDEELRVTYDTERTLKEIRKGKWQRIALQFPDEMLPDAPRVFQLLSRGLTPIQRQPSSPRRQSDTLGENKDASEVKPSGDSQAAVDTNELAGSVANGLEIQDTIVADNPRLYILGDTSYGTCCVDEVAAEHVNADVVVHYGRACLSPTARLPVIHVFTHKRLDHETVVAAFKDSYPNREERVIVVADVTFADHVDAIVSRLERDEGYANIFATQVVHDPSSPIPNRTIPSSVRKEPETLRDWQLFHISEPPTALLLTLSSRVSAIRIYSTEEGSTAPQALLASTSAALRRRYAIITSLNTVPVFGILINTLSVKNYLHIVEHVQKRIADAGKKSYMFVVGKLNAAKVANFSEIGGWVVIGCWESSLVDNRDFWKSIITPYELELALQSDADRIWTGAWSSDYQSLLEKPKPTEQNDRAGTEESVNGEEASQEEDTEDEIAGPESAPPEYDLRTGRYVSASSSRPMAVSETNSASRGGDSKSLAKRANGEVATIAGVVSPGAEYLKTQRTWGGLGSDFAVEYEENGENGGAQRGTAVVEGRSGIARGYTVGHHPDRR